MKTYAFFIPKHLLGKQYRVRSSELKNVLDKVVKILKYVKHGSFKTRLFHKMCEEMEANYMYLLLHTKARLLSHGKAFSL